MLQKKTDISSFCFSALGLTGARAVPGIMAGDKEFEGSRMMGGIKIGYLPQRA